MLAEHQRFSVHSGNVQEVNVLFDKLDAAESDIRVDDPSISAEQYAQRRGLVIQLKKELRSTAPELASLVTVTKFPVAQIQSLLAEDEVLVEYYYKDEDLYSFVVTRQHVQGTRLDGTDLLSHIHSFRTELANPKSDKYKLKSQTLYNILFKPIKHLVKRDKLIIVPHGSLHYLPFNALYSGSSYLIDRFHIRMLPSAIVAQFLKDRTYENKENNLMAFGNPDLGNPELDLVFAEDEAISISKIWPESRVLLRKDAKETSLKKFGSQFKQIHFASHGKFSMDDPLNSSGLLLVGDNEDDGFLSVGELYALKLNADLVTLSACETAMGDVANGDDVIGFTRGFLYAGASSIVSSLWSVNDRATRDLMIEFYSLMRNTTKLDALRQAQLVTKKRYRHPFYWAPFQLTGNAQ